MDRIIVGFEGERTLSRICEILETSGIRIYGACRSGAEVMRKINGTDGAIVLCGYKLLDITAEALYADMPPGFQMLMLANREQLEMCESDGIFKLPAPVKRNDLTDTLNMLLALSKKQGKHQAVQRTEEETALIRQAKELLMDRNCMTEEQAHRFIQKRSMDTGAKMIQTAKLILGGETTEKGWA